MYVCICIYIYIYTYTYISSHTCSGADDRRRTELARVELVPDDLDAGEEDLLFVK